jgi:hypothetical protein
MIAHFLQRAFAVEFLFQPAQRLIHGFTFFQSYLGQTNFTPLQSGLLGQSIFRSQPVFHKNRSLNLATDGVNGQKRRNDLQSGLRIPNVPRMTLPDKPVTLTVEQVAELNKKLSTLRHDINGDLALIVAAAELIKLNPSTAERMLTTLLEQPAKIRGRADTFSAEFENVMGIKRETKA